MPKDRNLQLGTVGAVMPEDDVIVLLDNLSSLIAKLGPYLDYLLSDALTPAQRRSFREHAGRARVFDLSNEIYRFGERMNALCSETARKTMIDKHSIKHVQR